MRFERTRVIFLMMVGFIWLFIPYVLETVFGPIPIPAFGVNGFWLSVLGNTVQLSAGLLIAAIIPTGIIATSGHGRFGYLEIGLVIAPTFVMSLVMFLTSDLSTDTSGRILSVAAITRVTEIVVPYLAMLAYLAIFDRLMKNRNLSRRT